MSNQPKSDKSLDKSALLNKFLIDNKIKLNPAMSFPIYNQLPDELQLAIKVLNRHEPKFDIEVVSEEEAEVLTPKE